MALFFVKSVKKKLSPTLGALFWHYLKISPHSIGGGWVSPPPQANLYVFQVMPHMVDLSWKKLFHDKIQQKKWVYKWVSCGVCWKNLWVIRLFRFGGADSAPPPGKIGLNPQIISCTLRQFKNTQNRWCTNLQYNFVISWPSHLRMSLFFQESIINIF